MIRNKLISRNKRKIRIKKKIKPERGLTRLCVYRSNQHVYAQLIDDMAGKVLTAVSTMSKDIADKAAGHANVAAAKVVGAAIAKRATELKITRVCFDRNGYRFHGKVKAVADAAREAGLKF